MVGEKVHNFVDILTQKILDYYSIPNEYSKDDFELISVGSIANKATPNCIVLGSGIAYENMGVKPDADWRFVRGPYTREAILNRGGSCPEIYGDAGLLVPKFWKESAKKYDIGLIPHMKEYHLVNQQYPNDFVINLNNPNSEEVARQITSCRRTISSSLHGIIVSHAYGIPCARVEFSDKILGDGTKYKDHYASICLEHRLSTIENPHFTTPTSINLEQIEQVFMSLK
jgi:hypothetical protein